MGLQGSQCQVLLLVFGLVVSPSVWANIFDSLPAPSVCSDNDTDTNNTGNKDPVMPSLPPHYTFCVEASMKLGGWIYEMEEYVDTTSMSTIVAAILVYGKEGKRQTIFNSDPLERYEIVDDDTCETKPGGVDFHPLAFASLDKSAVDPSKISFAEMFKSGASASDLRYVDQTEVRGMKVDHWTSCQEWTSKSAKVQIDYYFRVPDHVNTFSQSPVPMRVKLTGTTGDFETLGIPKSHAFANSYDILSFESKPFRRDKEVFLIPNNVVCSGRSEAKAMPRLPSRFEMDVTLSSPHIGSSVPLVTSLRYDWNNQILETVREWVRPQGLPRDKRRHRPIGAFQTNSKTEQAAWSAIKTFSWVEDFITGLQYITLKNNNTCIVRQLPTTSNSMTHANMLLRLYKDHKAGIHKFTYQGRSTFRNLPVESWGMDSDGMVQKVFFLARSKGATDLNVDTSNMTDQDRKDFENGILKLSYAMYPRFPVLVGIILRNRTSIAGRHFPTLVKDLFEGGVLVWANDEQLKMNMDASDKGYEDPDDSTLNLFYSWTLMQDMTNEHIGEMDVMVNHFTPLHVDHDLFHVSQCYSSDEISRVILIIEVSFEKWVRHNPTIFKNTFRISLARAMGVSIVQISDVQATPFVNHFKDIDYTLLSLNLLGSTPVEEAKREHNDIEEVKKRLVNAVRTGVIFTVQYYQGSKSFIVDHKYFAMDDDLDDFVKEVSSKTGPSDDAAGNRVGDDDQNDDNKDDDGDKGYSGGVLAGVSVAAAVITLIITISVYLLFHKLRQKPDTSLAVPYSVLVSNHL